MTRLLLVVIILIVVAAAVAWTLWTLISRAVNNAFDWFILTFGNDDAVRKLKRERGWDI